MMMNTMSASIVAFDTALGTCAVRWTDAGIASVRLPSPRTAGLPHITPISPVPPQVRAAIDGIVEVLAGRPVDLRFVTIDKHELDGLRRAVYGVTREQRRDRGRDGSPPTEAFPEAREPSPESARHTI